MAFLRLLRAFFTSRWLWTFLGLACLALLVWFFAPFVRFGEAEPFVSETVRLGIVAGLFLLWLVWMILARRRAARANRLFVTELAAPPPPPDPDAEAVAAVGARFQEVLDALRRGKAGGRRSLREIPWYVIIGPPAGGKTTALRQSGLEFPIDPGDDLRGVGGTRNCDWFFAEQAVLIDTAGRYALQESQPKADAAEWLAFLDLLRKHRGRRALNGVLVAIPVDVLAEGEAAVRAHGREIRKRLAEVYERLGMRLPVYLVLTKADLIAGFEPSFADLGTAEREQVWGATFAPGERAEGSAVGRALAALVRRLEERLGPRMDLAEDLATRAAIFRFPAQVASLEPALRVLVDTLFGESRYEDSAWLRGFYLTSATQEGTPIDRLTGALAASFGLPAVPGRGPSRVERRSFFLRRLLTDVIFPEAGLATLDPRAEARRIWAWRGGAVAAAAVLLLGLLGLSFAYLSNRGAVAAQASAFERLRGSLATAAAQQVPRDIAHADLALGLDAAAEVEAARAPLPGRLARAIGPSAAPAVEAAQETAFARTLRTLLEPRMVALLEATMWRQIRDPNFTLDALKAYQMMTGTTAVDVDFLGGWWTTRLPEAAAIPPFPNAGAEGLQLAAIARMPDDPDFIAPDPALTAAALRSICSIPLSRRAYAALLADPAAVALKDWVPAAHAGPNGAKVFTRRSGKTLRVGVEGIYTYAGYHEVVLSRLAEVADKAVHDAVVFTEGCAETAAATADALSQDMLKLYYDDFIAQWDGLLHDLTLAPLTDLASANETLKDLASADSALRRLLTAVVAETDLVRPPDPGAAPVEPSGVSKYFAKLGKLGKAAKAASKFAPGGAGAGPDTSGQAVSDHFRPLRATIAEVDGAPPALDTAAPALASLSTTLQTIAAGPDPERAIKEQGGLAALTGAVLNEAQALPDPVGAWLSGIAGDTTKLARGAVVSQLNAAWAADARELCQVVAGRYPLDPTNPADITAEDFARVFGPGQLIDTFIETQAKPFIDMTNRPWRWRSDLGLDPKALAALEQARRIRDALFPGGAGPSMAFTLEPKDLSPSAARVELDLDGQPLAYFNSAAKPQAMTWPGTDGSGMITLTFVPADGSPEARATETGPWAWLRMLRGNLSPGPLPEVFRLRLAKDGYSADFELRAASVDNPFDLSMFGDFACPVRF